jgi:hypothetical protein
LETNPIELTVIRIELLRHAQLLLLVILRVRHLDVLRVRAHDIRLLVRLGLLKRHLVERLPARAHVRIQETFESGLLAETDAVRTKLTSRIGVVPREGEHLVRETLVHVRADHMQPVKRAIRTNECDVEAERWVFGTLHDLRRHRALVDVLLHLHVPDVEIGRLGHGPWIVRRRDRSGGCRDG